MTLRRQRAFGTRCNSGPMLEDREPEEAPITITIHTHPESATMTTSDFQLSERHERVTGVSMHVWRTTLTLAVRSAVDEPDLAHILHTEVQQLDCAASRFRRDSELSAVNRAAGDEIEISDYLAEVLQVSIDSAELTDGLVDPTIGDLVDAAGYRAWRDGAGSIVPRAADMRGRRTWRDVELSGGKGARRVRIPAGTALDVGAVAKGWLADRLAQAAHERFGVDALANMGGDLRAVGGPWPVAVDPGVPGVRPQTLQIWDAGLATSSTMRRRWRTADGATAHHLVDPRTGRPADSPWLSSSALLASAWQANAASTAGVILGPAAAQWLADRDVDAWLVGAGGDSVRVGRWPTP